MMMKALEAGGLEPAFKPERDELNDKYGDEHYKPNPNGFYELDRAEYRDENFPLMYKGKLVKCLMGGLTGFPVAKYQVVFMRRDKEEIRQSFEAFFNPRDEGAERMRYFIENKFEDGVSKALSMLRNRKDTEVTEIWYRDVVKDPITAFRTLAANGWPILMHQSASIVNPELCRFKRENLVDGL